MVDNAASVGISLPLYRQICNACYVKTQRLIKAGKNKSSTSESPQRTSIETENDQDDAVATNKRTSSGKKFKIPKTPEALREILGSNPSSTGSNKSEVSATEIIDVELAKRNLNDLLKSLNLQKLSVDRMRSRKYKIEKFDEMKTALAKYIFDELEIEDDEVIPQLEEKFLQTTNRREKVAILSCLPKSWNANQMSKNFNISHKMAKNIRSMVTKHGILFNVSKKTGSQTLANSSILVVRDFYRSDKISRACPGLRDYVIHTENGEKKTIQRRMVFVNLKEAFEIFKEMHNNVKVGFSKFAA